MRDTDLQAFDYVMNLSYFRERLDDPSLLDQGMRRRAGSCRHCDRDQHQADEQQHSVSADAESKGCGTRRD